jgi:hypothetical protein
MQRGVAASEFTRTFIFYLGMQLLKRFTVHPPMNFSTLTFFRSKKLNHRPLVLFSRVHHLIRHF